MKYAKLTVITLLLIAVSSCGGRKEKFVKNPVDEIVKEMPSDRVFSILLYDMNVEGNFFEDYYHKYRIIEEKTPGQPEERLTDWVEVSESQFKQHVDDMGMELVSRGEDGKLLKDVSPPGYNNYVGNEKYGQWTQRNGGSFWEFYGKYAFMSSMFRMFAYPVNRSYYNDYRGNYYGRGRAYYGPTAGGSSYYGTNSNYTKTTRANSTWSNNRSSFKNRVNSRTSRSSSSTSRTSRSSSRYGSSSSRSRGGGFGK